MGMISTAILAAGLGMIDSQGLPPFHGSTHDWRDVGGGSCCGTSPGEWRRTVRCATGSKHGGAMFRGSCHPLLPEDRVALPDNLEGMEFEDGLWISGPPGEEPCADCVIWCWWELSSS